MASAKKPVISSASVVARGRGRMFLGRRPGWVVGWLMVASLVLPARLAATPAAPPGIEVESRPVRIERRTFDPDHPPPDMPKLTPPEAAACAYEYGFTVEIQVEQARTLLKLKPTKVTALKVTTRLDITIWLPVDATAKLTAHEEAHRVICETIYPRASAIARQLGQKAVGLTLQHSIKDEAALQAELKKLQGALMAACLYATAGSCGRVQQYFDSITAHGTNELPEDEAIAQALAQEPVTAGP